jgi:hypothetical protein
LEYLFLEEWMFMATLESRARAAELYADRRDQSTHELGDWRDRTARRRQPTEDTIKQTTEVFYDTFDEALSCDLEFLDTKLIVNTFNPDRTANSYSSVLVSTSRSTKGRCRSADSLWET